MIEHHIDVVVGFGDIFGYMAGLATFLVIRYIWQTLVP